MKLVIYPGERLGPTGATLGRIFVEGTADRYAVAGGPPKRGKPEAGGHTAAPTPAGSYTLGSAEHHTTQNWPYSAVPWGAELRDNAGVVEFRRGQAWVAASGPNGLVTRAWLLWAIRSRKPLPAAMASQAAREMFSDPRTGALLRTWTYNDFGKWSWNLKRDRQRTAYYIHTTPDNENNPADVSLRQSHGCLHILPRDRDDMMSKGYLRDGAAVEIKKYGVVGP